MTNLEPKRKRIEAFVKIAALLVLGFIIQPFVFLAIKGLVGLVVAGVSSLLAINVIFPWLAMKVANWRIKVIKYEASLNPIETLQNEYMQHEQSLLSKQDHIVAFAADVKGFAGELEELKQKFPAKAPMFNEQYQNMRALLENRKQKYEAAKEALLLFANQIEEAKAIWKVAQSALRVTKTAGSVQDEFFSRLKTETAFDSVQLSMNTAFAELEGSLMDESVKQTASLPPIVSQPKQLAEHAGPRSLDLILDAEIVDAPVRGRSVKF